ARNSPPVARKPAQPRFHPLLQRGLPESKGAEQRLASKPFRRIFFPAGRRAALEPALWAERVFPASKRCARRGGSEGGSSTVTGGAGGRACLVPDRAETLRRSVLTWAPLFSATGLYADAGLPKPRKEDARTL